MVYLGKAQSKPSINLRMVKMYCPWVTGLVLLLLIVLLVAKRHKNYLDKVKNALTGVKFFSLVSCR